MSSITLWSSSSSYPSSPPHIHSQPKRRRRDSFSRSGRRYNGRELFGKSGLISFSEKNTISGRKRALKMSLAEKRERVIQTRNGENRKRDYFPTI